MESLAKIFNHDFENGVLRLHDRNGNCVYHEDSDGYWFKKGYDTNNNCVYHESSYGNWSKREFDSNNNEIYYENSEGYIRDNRPKPSCHDKIVEIEGKKYKLKEVK